MEKSILTEKLTLKDFIVAPSVLLAIISLILAFPFHLIWYIVMLVFALIAESNEDYFNQFDARGLTWTTLKGAFGIKN